MALDNVLKIYDEQGNPVDYDILASDVKFQDGKDLPTKLGELEEEIGEGGYTPPQGGIPKTDLAPAVQTSLDKADSAYQKPASGIPATDIADGVIPDVSGFATKTEVQQGLASKVDKTDYTDTDKNKLRSLPANPVTSISVNGQTPQTPTQGNVNVVVPTVVLDDAPTAGSNNPVKSGGVKTALDAKADSSNVYPKSQTYTKTEVDDAIDDALDGFTPADVPTKVSDLTNDAGYQTQQQVAAAITQAAIEAVVGSGDFAMNYDAVNHIYNIVRLIPTITVSDESLAFDSTSKVKTITISGHNLKADIGITAPTGWTASVNSLAQVDGVVAETQVTLTYGGADASTASGDLVLTAGAATVRVQMSYTQYGGPTITVDPATLTFAAIGNQSQTKTATVGKFNITGEVSVAVSGGDGKFSASLSGSTLSVTYTPGNINSGSHSATITLSANGAQSKTVAVNGTVLEQSLTITSNPSPLSLQSDNGVAATGTINVKGQNITGNVSLSVNGSGFTLTENTLAAADVNSANGVDVTVTANIASGDTASATISASSGLAQASISAEWNKTETEPEPNSVVHKYYGYSSENPTQGTNADVLISFKVTSVATDNSDGTVRVVRSDDKEGYFPNDPNYTTLKKVIIPSTITIAGKTYKVTEIGGGTFMNSGLVYAEFETPSNVTAFLMSGNMTPFGSANDFKGTGTSDNIETFTYPSSITTTNGIVVDDFFSTLVRRVVVPDSVQGALSKGWRIVTHIDLGTGISNISSNNWYNINTQDFIFRKSGVVGINSYTAGQWASGSIIRTIHVPADYVETYKAEANWKTVLDAGKLVVVAITNN